jgi:hypothetical protein
MKIIRSLIGVAAISAALVSGSAHAALTSFQTYVGNYGVSTDGWASSTQAGTISASIPVGATVTAAYLYTSTFLNSSLTGVGGTLAGTGVNYSTNLGTNPQACCSLTAARADVTSIIKPLVDGGPGGVYDFAITETDGSQDGEALVVVYELASLGESTVGILDGFALVNGDTTAINFGTPLNPAAPGFFAEMSLGIGFSYDGTGCTDSGQTSTVTVNSTLITQNAGCNDDSADAFPANGNLFTMGGFDDAFSGLLPATANDHERYNLVPFVALGDTSISVQTANASEDDNIFLAVFRVSGRAGINEPPPPPTGVPEPMPLSLLGLGFAALVAQRKMMAKRA